MMDEDKNNNEDRNKGIMGCCDSKEGSFQAKRSIAERRGFSSNAAKINTSLFRTITTPTSSSLNPLGSSCPSLAVSRSPCFTIPPGISPTALLDSPIMLPNSQAMPSPTTGTFFQLPMFTNQQSMMNYEQRKIDDNLRTATDAAVASFKFKPHATNVDPKSLSHFSTSLNQVSNNCNMMNGRNSDTQHVQVQPSLDFSVSTDFPKRYDFDAHLYNDVKMVDDAYVNASNSDTLMSHSEDGSEESTQPKNVIQGSDIEQHPVLEEDQKETSHATEIVRSSEDGYNWRKYGQKQVKGCEYPRSYYKCTQPNCLVKKKVERSHDGQITAIIYKGSHNHLKPHNIHRGSALSSDEMLDMGEANESGVKVDGGLVWRNIQSRIRNAQQGLDWKGDFQERASADSTGTQLSDPISTSKAKSLSMLEAEDTPELSSTLASHDGNEDGTTQTLASHEDDFEHNESQSKRRKKESNLVESNLPPRAVREPRVVIQIETEVDILDDGYRWRKYGQKVVKGNPNPRSYYKCTSAGCPVRKHVERASHNIKYVLTTYEGKHNHGVPTARNNNHFRSNDGRLPPGSSNGQMALNLTGNASIPNPESLAPHFDRKPEISNEFLRSNLVGSFTSDMKFGPSSMYQMKYSSLNNTMPYGSYGLNHDGRAAPQGGSLSSVFPDYSMPPTLPSSGNFSMNGINFNRVRPMGPVHQSFHSGQHVKEIDSGFMRPKQEQKDDMMYSSCLPPLDHANSSHASSSASPSIYQRAMQNFPA